MMTLYLTGMLGCIAYALIKFAQKVGKSESQIETLNETNELKEKRDEIAKRAPDDATNLLKRMRNEDFKF